MTYQIFLVVVVSLILGGAALLNGFFREKIGGWGDMFPFLTHEIFLLVLGIISLIAGLVSFFTKTPEQVIIISDVIPSLALLGVGAHFVLNYIEEENLLPFLIDMKSLLNAIKYPLGYTALGAGVLHFLVPGVLFL